MPGVPGAESLSAADASNVILDAVDQVNVFLMAGILGPSGFVAADGSADLVLSANQPFSKNLEPRLNTLGTARTREVAFASLVEFRPGRGVRLAQVRARVIRNLRRVYQLRGELE